MEFPDWVQVEKKYTIVIVKVAEHVCDYMPKKILKLSAYALQVFLVQIQ